MVTVLGIVAFAFIFGLSVFAHEFGHFAMARKVGIKVHEFALGFPPSFLYLTIGNQEFWLPPQLKIGKLWGTPMVINLFPFGGYVNIDEGSLRKASKRVRAAVLLAGVGMNFILASICSSLCIYAIKPGASVFTIILGGPLLVVAIVEITLKALFTDPVGSLGGIISIYQVSRSATEATIKANNPYPIFFLFAALNAGLFVINLLPIIPALDGGKLLFLGLEAVFGKRIRKIEGVVMVVGAILILTLAVGLVVKDIVTPMPKIDWSIK